MTKQPPTNLEQFVNEFNDWREREGKKLNTLSDGAIDFCKELVKHRKIEHYFDVKKFTELHQQISESLDEEGLSDDERTDIALLGISLSHLIEERSVRNSNFGELSQAHKNFVTDIATRPGVNHAKIFIHALLTLDNEGVELLAQKSVANLPAESLVNVVDGIDFRIQKANIFVRSLIKEQANANEALKAENAVLQQQQQNALNQGGSFGTQQLSEHVGRAGR
jgi:hypothetical protein